MNLWLAAWAASLLTFGAFAGERLRATPVPMPGGTAGIGFDDMGFAPGMKKVVVPGGRTGKIFLVDPASRRISQLGGFSSASDYRGGHGEGVTTADEGRGFIFGCDRNADSVSALDPATGEIAARAKLGGHPDYVRYVAATGEVWVTEPNSERIETFALSFEGRTPALVRSGAIAVPGGPESLVVDGSRGRAYTHTWKSETLAVALKTKRIVARWHNGCAGSRGIALDEARAFLFVGCEEGKAVVLDAARDGKILSSLEAGEGVDVIAYSSRRRRLYLPGADSATLAILTVSDDGRLALAASVETAKGAHCAAADDHGQVWVCDPDHGRLLRFKDDAREP